MISGRQALRSIDQTLNQVVGQIEQVEQQVREASERLLAEQRAELAALRELARVRVDQLDDAALDERLDHADRQVLALLQRRDVARADVEKQIGQAERLRMQHEAERRDREAVFDAAVSAVDEAEGATQQRLNREPTYRAQREGAEQAARLAAHAQEKAQRSKDELAEKGAAYRGDPLFMYLWERAYGLPAYAANGLARWLDGKVARLIGFADARANFARLNEIPERLQEHAEHLAAQADAEFARLKALDEAAQAEDGIPALQARVDEEQRVLDDIDARIAAADTTHQALLAQRAAFASGDDEDTRQAVDYLANEFGRTDVEYLRRDALQTPYPEDDLIVSRLMEHEAEQASLKQSHDDLKGLMAKHRARLEELENLRIEFKRKRFDRPGSVFSGDSMVPMLLGQFLSGLLDSRMLWKVLQEHQRYRPRRSNPNFGSGGFGRGSVWRGGMGDIGDILGKMGGIGRGGGGGFRTGGGF